MKNNKESSIELEDYCLPKKVITKEEYCDEIISKYYNPKHETFTKEEYKKLYYEYISGDKEVLEKIRKKSLLIGLEIAKKIYCTNLYSGEFEDIAQDCLILASKKTYASMIMFTNGYLSTLKNLFYLLTIDYFDRKQRQSYNRNRDIWYEKNNGKIVTYNNSVDEVYAGDEFIDEMIENVVLRKDLSARLQKGILTYLSPREQEVIFSEFFDGKSKSEISNELSVSCERVRQIENKALRKLRLPQVSKTFRNYLK